MPRDDEIELERGTSGSVVRVGDTVRRPAGPWTPAVHALLAHLHAAGFAGAPRALGIDERGREILTWIDGEAARRPWPVGLRGIDGLVALARMLRSSHTAVATFRPPPDAEWRIGRIPLERGGIIRHGDLGPWNTIWRGGTPVAIIDWDLAEPGEALDDLAQLAWHAPLRGEDAWRAAGFTAAPDLGARLRALCAAYGDAHPAAILDRVDRLQVIDLARIAMHGAAGREPWRTYAARGDAVSVAGDLAWLRAHRGDLAS